MNVETRAFQNLLCQVHKAQRLQNSGKPGDAALAVRDLGPMSEALAHHLDSLDKATKPKEA